MTSLAQSIPCLICGDSLTVRLARGRKSGKPFIMLICGRDGRHFRYFPVKSPRDLEKFRAGPDRVERVLESMGRL